MQNVSIEQNETIVAVKRCRIMNCINGITLDYTGQLKTHHVTPLHEDFVMAMYSMKILR